MMSSRSSESTAPTLAQLLATLQPLFASATIPPPAPFGSLRAAFKADPRRRIHRAGEEEGEGGECARFAEWDNCKLRFYTPGRVKEGVVESRAGASRD